MPLHPFMAEMLAKSRAAQRPAFSDGTVEQARELLAAVKLVIGSGPALRDVRELQIPVRQGEIGARLFVPVETPVGVIVYLHGGGWIAGTLDDFDTVSREIAQVSQCAVLLVDYRLAPEHPFPIPLHDTLDATRWLHRHLHDLFGRALPIVLAGDSAGGNLAAVAALELRGEIHICLQALVYPVLDSDFDRPSYRTHGADMPLTRKDMMWFFETYLLAEGSATNPRVSPYRTASLKGAPPALILTAEYDVLCDEGMAYAQRLEHAGIPTRAQCLPGMTHGFFRLHNLLEPARQAVHGVANAAHAACTGSTRSPTHHDNLKETT